MFSGIGNPRYRLGIIRFDWMSLPDMTGSEAARALKQNPQTAHIPIVGCSAHFGPEWRDQALRSGMVGYVQKPVPRKDIEAIIAQFILLER